MEKTETNRDFNIEFGAFVQKKRLALGWTQSDLAAKIGNNYQNISRLERGIITPTLFWCYKLAEAFEMNLSTLIDDFGYKVRS